MRRNPCGQTFLSSFRMFNLIYVGTLSNWKNGSTNAKEKQQKKQHWKRSDIKKQKKTIQKARTKQSKMQKKSKPKGICICFAFLKNKNKIKQMKKQQKKIKKQQTHANKNKGKRALFSCSFILLCKFILKLFLLFRFPFVCLIFDFFQIAYLYRIRLQAFNTKFAGFCRSIWSDKHMILAFGCHETDVQTCFA